MANKVDLPAPQTPPAPKQSVLIGSHSLRQRTVESNHEFQSLKPKKRRAKRDFDHATESSAMASGPVASVTPQAQRRSHDIWEPTTPNPALPVVNLAIKHAKLKQTRTPEGSDLPFSPLRSPLNGSPAVKLFAAYDKYSALLCHAEPMPGFRFLPKYSIGEGEEEVVPGSYIEFYWENELSVAKVSHIISGGKYHMILLINWCFTEAEVAEQLGQTRVTQMKQNQTEKNSLNASWVPCDFLDIIPAHYVTRRASRNEVHEEYVLIANQVKYFKKVKVKFEELRKRPL